MTPRKSPLKTAAELLIAAGTRNADVVRETTLSKQRVSQIARASGQTREGEAAHVRRQILTLADGTLTFDEIAAAINREPSSVKWIVHHLRRAGHKVPVLRKNQRGRR